MKKIFKKNQVIITALAIMIAVAGYLSFSDTDFGMEEASTQTADSTILEDIDSLDYDVSDETALLEENTKNSISVSPTDSPAAEDGTDADGTGTPEATGTDSQETDAADASADGQATDASADGQATDASADGQAADASADGQAADASADALVASNQGMDAQASEDISTDTPGEAVLTGSTGFAAQAKISREQIRSQNKENLMEIIDNPDVSEEQKEEAVSSMVALSDIAEKESAAEVLLESKGFSDVVVNLTGDSADVVVPDDQLDDTSRAQIEDIVKRKTEVATENIVITPLSEAAD